jgi:hypothetical protein
MFQIYLPYILLVCVALVSFLIYKSHDIQRTYKATVLHNLERCASIPQPIVTADDLSNLPLPVQKYLTYVGVLGQEKVQSYRIVLDAEMMFNPKKDWARTRFEQYNFFDDPTRLFLVKMNMLGLSVIGLDSYINGKGNMHIKAAGLVTVANAQGEHMDRGEAITLFNDMCLMAPATLIDARITWETIDPLTVRANYNDGRNQVSAQLYFNDESQLINFVTEDRFYTNLDNTFKNVRWSTPVSNYRDVNGLMLSTHGEAIWHLPEGDFCYAKVTNIRELEYNCRVFK